VRTPTHIGYNTSSKQYYDELNSLNSLKPSEYSNVNSERRKTIKKECYGKNKVYFWDNGRMFHLKKIKTTVPTFDSAYSV
jgi:hypothetical protein